MVVNISMGSESKIKLWFDIIKNEDLEPKLGKYDMIRLKELFKYMISDNKH